MLIRRLFLVGGFGIASILACEPARSAGYFIDQQSIPGLGRANAGNVAAANDPSTIFFNPAGMTELWLLDPSDTTRSSVGLSLIVPLAQIKNRGSTTAAPGTGGTVVPLTGFNESNPTDPTPVSSAYMAKRMSSRAFFGLGINAPFGLAAEYGDDWFGRYDATKVKLLTVAVNPSFAYTLTEQLSIGAGFDVQYAYAELASAVPNPLTLGGPTAATDGRLSIDGDDIAVGYNLGILYKVVQQFRVGAHYRSGINHSLEGTALLRGTQLNVAGPIQIGASSELRLPAIASVGAVWDFAPRWSLYGDATWYGWSVSEVTRIKFTGGILPDAVRPSHFRDSYTGALGLENRMTDTLTVRAGVMFDQSPTNDLFRDTTFADDDRLWLAVGATYRISETLMADFAYTHVLVEDTSIDITRTFFGGTPLQTTTAIQADVDSSVNTVAFNLRYKF